MSIFAHLRVHSDFSLGRGTSKIPDLVARAKSFGQPAMALTDEEALHGALELTKYCVKAGIQPIVGAKVYLPLSKKSDKRGSVILLAQSARGYANVCRLVNMELTPGRSRTGTLDREMWVQVGGNPAMIEDVIMLAGCGADGLIGMLAQEKEGREAASGTLGFLKRFFHDRLYVEICRSGHPDQKAAEVEAYVLGAAVDLDLPIVATSAVWYATPDRHDAYAILKAVYEKDRASVSGTEDGLTHASPVRYHMRSTEEMWELFSDIPEAFDNACEIARRCAFMAHQRKPILPPFATEGGRSEGDEMRSQAREGLEMRLSKMTLTNAQREEYFDRLDFELGVIEKMGFPGYFLIVSDFIKFAIGKDIPVGPGRGSGAGSVVAWALMITDIDPLRFGLLFERFLNPERVSMPDFDVDFCEDRRGEVIKYVEDRYGRERVAGIVSFSEFKSKSSLKDVSRVLQHAEDGPMTPAESFAISNLVPKPKNGVELKLSEVFDSEAEFREKIQAKPRTRLVYKHMLEVQGLYRNAGVHAAGIVIAGAPLTDLVPVGFDTKGGFPIVQFDMKEAEAAGLVKFDFLGLTTLSVIKEALNHVKGMDGLEIDMSILPYDDRDALRIFTTARTTGVFQFESEGMKKSLLDVKPDRIEDLIAINALFRPGPMEMIPTYARCKNGLEDPEYPAPADKTQPILEETFGIMVYQEQVIQVARTVAGMSLGAADLLRRAMGKKDRAEMERQKSIFVTGAKAGGVSEKEAVSLFETIEKFANYGFNKSHAAAYSVVAYQTAWLKAHHPVAFFSALLSYVKEPERMALIKQDIDEFRIEFLPPDVNASEGRFRPERLPDGTLGVRFGLTAVKGVTSAAIDPMVKDRKANGPFKDLQDFQARVGHFFNSAQIKRLAEAGAFVSINPEGNRQQSFEILSFLSKNVRKDTGSADLFGGQSKITIRADILEMAEWDGWHNREYDAVGFFFRRHPLDQFEAELGKAGVRTRKYYVDLIKAKRASEFKGRMIVGMIEQAEMTTDFKGRPVARIRLAERAETGWLRVEPNAELTPEYIIQLCNGAIKARKPVVISADFTQGRKEDAGVFIHGRSIEMIEHFLAKHWSPSTYCIDFDVRSDQRKLIFDMELRKKLDALDRRFAGGADQTDCQIEMRDLLWETIAASLRQIESLIESQKTPVPDGEQGDEIVVQLILRLGTEDRVRRMVAPLGSIFQIRFRMNPKLFEMLAAKPGVVGIRELENHREADPPAPAEPVAAISPVVAPVGDGYPDDYGGGYDDDYGERERAPPPAVDATPRTGLRHLRR